jgi:hypothetical protein
MIRGWMDRWLGLFKKAEAKSKKDIKKIKNKV